MKCLLTGVAGFIGMHTAKALLEAGLKVHGVDNFAPFYDPQLKRNRLAQLQPIHDFAFEELDIADRERTRRLFDSGGFDVVVHLAAQPGVRYSLEHPEAYIDNNVVGFGNILEGCRHTDVKHLIYASSSSVYGRNHKIPFVETDPVILPASLYATTKRVNELMAETYHHLYGLPCTGLRLFTVYGPWGRPDMAYFKFTKLLYAGEPLPLFNGGKHRRDMTYIDDIIEGIMGAIQRKPGGHRFYNLGNNAPVELWTLVHELEDLTHRKAHILELPFQEGDVFETYADIKAAATDLGFKPGTSLRQGLESFVSWYKRYYSIAAHGA